MQPSTITYLNAVQSFGSIDDLKVSERHNVSLGHKFAVLDRLNESIQRMDLNHYFGWDELHGTNPIYEIPNTILVFRIRSKDDYKFTIAFLVEAFLSYAASVLDVSGKDIMHAHDLARRGLSGYPSLRQIIDKQEAEFPGSPLAKLWASHYPKVGEKWVYTLKKLRNYYLHEDICGPVFQMRVMIQTKPEVLLDEESFPFGVRAKERALTHYCPTVISQLNQLTSDTYSLMASEIQRAGKFPL